MQTPKKIVLITLDYPPQTGGVARYLGNLAKQAEDDMEIIVGHASPDDASNVHVRMLTGNTYPSWWPTVFVCRSYPRASTEILVSHVLPIGTAAWISFCLGGPEYSVLLHGLDVRLVQGGWKRWLFRRICRGARAVITNSLATKEDVLRIDPKLVVSVVTPGVENMELPTREEARRMLNRDPQEEIVLSVGRLIPRKGIDVAIQVMGRIQKERNVRYVVVGDGTDLPRLETLASQHRTQVEWHRSCSDEEKWRWFAAADLFLLPVRDEGVDVEGFGIVFLEAAIAGTPSVAGRSGGASEAVVHESTGLLVKPTDGEAVEHAVMRLLRDMDFRLMLGEQAKKRAETDFRWKDRWKTIKNLIGC